MAKESLKFHIKNFLSPPTTELSPFLVDNNQLVIANGCNLSYKKGVIMKDLGYSIIGATLQADKSILGLHNFRQSTATQKMLATVNDATGDDDTRLLYSTGAGWTEIAAAETAWNGKEDILTEFEDFIGYCFIVGYGSTDGFLPVGSLTGTTFDTSVNVTNMPSAKYIKRYRDRIYIGNCDISGTAYPYRVYFSSVPSGSTITWTVASDFIDVDYSEAITGLADNWDRLIIFTEFSTYLYDQDSKKKKWAQGCVNNRTIQTIGSSLIWANVDNVWISNGSTPIPLGNDILELIKQSTYTNWRSAVVDREYNIYLGTTSANGITYTNCLATFNIETGMWRWRELADNVKSMAKRTTTTDDFLWLGMADGEVMLKSKYTDSTPVYADNGTAITSHFRTKAYDLGDPSIQKRIDEIVAYCEFGQGLTLRFRIYDNNQEVVMPFTDIGRLNKVINIFNDKTITGHFIQFEGKELSAKQIWKFFGLSIRKIVKDSD